jgi:UDP-N-acetylmuramoyl-tripeptide--D-alanyl-D-alanine ligase
LGEQGVAVINADDPFNVLWRGLNTARRVVSFGVSAPAEVSARHQARGLTHQVTLTTPWGACEFNLAVPGVHNVRNALAAAAAALAAGATLEAVAQGLGAWQGVKGRLNLRQGLGGALLIDDTYNANPDSVRAGIDVLAATPGRKILVLGDMGEIGERSAQYHDEIGGYAKSAGVDLLFSLGELAELAARNFGEHGRHFSEADDLIEALRPHLNPDASVLVKGSRFMRMERISDALAVSMDTL